MPALGLNATWGAEDWASFVLQHLSTQSVLLRAGARFVPVAGRVAHIPRTLTDGTATWTAEGVEISSSAPTGDELLLTPKKLANVVTLSNESVADAPVPELDAVGIALTRSVATAIDVRAFSASAVTAIAPAGLLVVGNGLQSALGPINVDSITTAVGAVEAVGGVANAVFVNPANLTALRLLKDGTGSQRPLLQPDAQAAGATRIAGAVLWPCPALPVGTAIVGDAGQIIVAVRKDVQVLFSGHAKFTADSLVARVTARADWGVNDGRGLVVISG